MPVIDTTIKNQAIFDTHHVDMRSRKSMEQYLASHTTYWEPRYGFMNSKYAHNVKIPHLHLPEHVKEKAWEFVDMEWPLEWDWIVENINYNLKEETGHTFYGAGRSGGWIVFEGGKDNDLSYQEDDHLYFDELKRIVQEVKAFDRAIEDLREQFIFFLEGNEIIEETYTTTHTRKIFQPIN